MSVELANRFTRRWVERLPVGENAVVCGVGAWALLAALLAGAGGRAAEELAAVVGLHRVEAAAGFAGIASVVRDVPGLCFACGLWARPDVVLWHSYTSSLAGLTVGWLGGDAAELDRWTAEATNGLLPTFPARLTAETRLAVATAVAADVAWVTPFTGGMGMGWNGTGVRYTDLVRRTAALDDAAVIDGGAPISRVTCATTGGLAVQLVAGQPGAGPAVVLGAALDALAGRATVAVGSELSLGQGAGCLQVAETRGFDPAAELVVHVPAFEVGADHDLLADAELFGLATASDMGHGHFPDLAAEPLAIEAAAQGVTAAFSEQGFRAAAVTAALPAAGGIPSQVKRTIRVDHNRPFGFLAVERRTGLVLFAGWVNDVKPFGASGPVVR